MGGCIYQAARSVNVAQELRWQKLPGAEHARTVDLFRKIEREALTLQNERSQQKSA